MTWGLSNKIMYLQGSSIRALDDMYMIGSAFYLENNKAIWMEATSTNAYEVLKVNTSNNVVLGSTSLGDMIVRADTFSCANTDNVRLPYAAASSPANGSIWMESDGLHIYYGGSEYTVAGV